MLTTSATSRLDFKRLLLQQSIKSGPVRISAAEQLKLSRQQCLEQPQQQASPCKPSQQSPLSKILSPRSAWRFQTPRTDVLSSTIIEDAAAEEKAMKPSPESSRDVPARRQLDLSGPEEPRADDKPRPLDKRDKELENRLQAESADPVKAIESRRASNQLARAQFLASAAPSPPKDLFGRRFRARSESPQQKAPRSKPDSPGGQLAASTASPVSRSPSAPALETAL